MAPVMVIEDDLDIREALVDLLEASGYEVASAPNGAEALKYLRALDILPCLILLDLMMPVMDGIAFREAQLQDSRLAQIPVVVLSAYRDLQQSAGSIKGTNFIKKPPRREELLAAIDQHCEAKRI